MDTDPAKKERFFSLAFLTVAFLIGLVLHNFLLPMPAKQISYGEFKSLLNEGRVTRITVGDHSIYGTLKTNDRNQVGAAESSKSSSASSFSTVRAEDPELIQTLKAAGVEFTRQQPRPWYTDLASWLLAWMALIAVWYSTKRRQVAGANQPELRRPQRMQRNSGANTATFAGIAGLDQAKEELTAFLPLLDSNGIRGPDDARLSNGILLVGPPGTGKTALARAFAQEAKVPLLSISGYELAKPGFKAARIRKLFKRARQKAPAVIFIDHLDAMSGSGQSAALTQLSKEMDDLSPEQPLLVVAAARRSEALDSALLHDGRFDHQVAIERPDKPARIAILATLMRGLRLECDVSVNTVAAITPGFAGADLENVVNEAARLAARRASRAVSMNDFDKAISCVTVQAEGSPSAERSRT
jgi:cell division protease FtsH